MNLRTALEVYRREGPRQGLGDDARATATRVVHLYLTPAEHAALVRAWSEQPVGRGPFLQALGDVEARLRLEGHV